MKSSYFPDWTHIGWLWGAVRADDSTTAEYRVFLSYLLPKYAGYGKIGGAGILVAAACGLGAGSLCLLVQLGLRLPVSVSQSLYVAGAVIMTAAVSIVAYRTLLAYRIRQSARLELAGAFLDANRV